MSAEHPTSEKSLNFIEEMVEKDLESGKYPKHIHTRFPPEPNGYLHIGHAKSICLNFGLAQKYGGKTNLRFDDTNPTTEKVDYVNSIRNDVQWLGFQWDAEYYASDYFEQIFQYALDLIKKGKAYVDFSSAEEIAAKKGTPTVPGTPTPYRNTTIEENIDRFYKMRAGVYPDGYCTLRAKIDLAHPNMHLRDPLMYRIKHEHHHRTGDAWCIYPMYDFAHGQSDSLEQITHSICTLEFESHRPLYNWYIKELGIFPSEQTEFARLNLTYTVMSKRKLLQLVEEKLVSGWDDPRMPTISGLRRRGFSAAALRLFCDKIGIARRENTIDVGLLEFCVREDLNKVSKRVMAILDPIKLTITNFDENEVKQLEIENNPEDPDGGTRKVPFSKHLLIEKDDFMENPPKGYFRLAPQQMVRLKGACIIRCDEVVKDENGAIKEILCSIVDNSSSGNDTSGVKVKGTIHWLSAAHAEKGEVRLYDRLFSEADPEADPTKNYKEFINPDALTTIPNAHFEPSLKEAKLGEHFQFIRLGYFCLDTDSSKEHLIFNRTVTLKDAWAKTQK